jgi:hypothetical protein
MNAYRHLSGHLEQLAATLVGLGRQMRDAVSSAVSRSAAEALRQGLASLLRQSGEGPGSLDGHRPFDPSPRLGTPYRRGIPPRSDRGEIDHLDDWHEPDQQRWDRREAGDWRGRRYDGRDDHDEYGRDDDQDGEPNDPDRHALAQERPIRSGWRSLLAAGCRLVAWLLGRLAAPGARLLALGAGLATAMAVWLGGAAPATGSLTDALAAATNAIAGLTG